MPGASAVDVDYGVRTATLDKAPLKQAMSRSARNPVLLADASKFGLRATFRICPLSALSRIITDKSLPAEVQRAIREEGVEVDVV